MVVGGRRSKLPYRRSKLPYRRGKLPGRRGKLPGRRSKTGKIEGVSDSLELLKPDVKVTDSRL